METTNNKIVLPALRGVLGDWVYYSSLMSGKQITNIVKAAKDIRESKALDEVLQRDLNDRKAAIAKYLLKRDSRFFNSIIIGVFDGIPDWIEFKFNNSNDYNISEQELEGLKSSMGFLILNGDEKLFAIDGQHRVAGIKIAEETDTKLDLEKQVLKDDQFSVIFVAHLDTVEGQKRTRRLFSDINKNAKAVAEGDKIKIDEDDINAIVTRRLYAKYKYFNEGKLISLTENARLEENDKSHFTNLLGLNNVNKVLKKLFKKQKGVDLLDEKNISLFYSISSSFFDFIITNITELKSYFINSTLTLEQTRNENKYLLFRPIGLKILARLYTFYYNIENGLEELTENINKINFIFPESPFNKILWNNGKMDAKSKNQNIAFNLSLYLLGKLSAEDEDKLLDDYRDVLKNNEINLPKKF